jgi:transcription regulator MmyB-like protein
MDRHWNILRTNAAADTLFAWLLDGADAGEPPNVVRLMFGPLRPHVANWNETGEALVQRVHREAVGGIPDPKTLALLEAALAYPGVPAEWRAPDFGRALLPVVPIEFEKDGLTLSYFSTVTTLGTPQDAVLQEIRVESFCPADDATAAHRWD